MDNNAMKKEFDDWVALLKRTNNEDLLKDPFNVWIEAWSVATILAEQKKDPVAAGS